MLRPTAYALLLVSLFSHAATAQTFRVPSVDDKRTGKVEFTFQLFNTFDEDFSAARDVDVEQDSQVGIGFGLAYNFTEHWALGFDFTWLEPDYTVNYIDQDGQPRRFSAEADVFTGQFKGIYNVFEGNLTPYVEAGAGWTYYDSNVSDGSGFVFCFWDPIFGRICRVYTDTYDETNFSYGGGVGMRWEATDRLLLKASYNLLSVNFTGSGTSEPLLQTIKFEIGTRY